MDPSKISEWSRWVEEKAEWYAAAYEFIPYETNVVIPKIKELVNEGDLVLDVACGHGKYAQYVVAQGGVYTGVDWCPEMIGIAEAKNPDNDFVLSDVMEYKPTKEFDLAFIVQSTYCFKGKEGDLIEHCLKIAKKVVVFNPNNNDVYVRSNS